MYDFLKFFVVWSLFLQCWGGCCLFHGATTRFLQETWAWKKLKIFTLLHAFLVCFLTCCFCPQGWGGSLYHGAKHPFMRATRAWKFSKSLLFFTYFMSNFLTCCCCSQGRGPFLFHCVKHPCMRATRARKIQKYLLYCMISLSGFWLAPAVLQAGWLVYFIVQSTLSCEQLKLEIIETLCSIAWFPCILFDMLLQHGLVLVMYWWCFPGCVLMALSL